MIEFTLSSVLMAVVVALACLGWYVKGENTGYCQRACEPEAVVHVDAKECICTTKRVTR